MQIFRVQPLPAGPGASPFADYVKVEGADELDAARRLMKIPLQRTARPDMYIRAFVHRNVTQGAPIKIYAAETT
jgi:hypothetical protein